MRKNIVRVIMSSLGVTAIILVAGLALLTPRQYDLLANGIAIGGVVLSIMFWGYYRARKRRFDKDRKCS